MENQIALPDSIQHALRNLRLAIESNDLNPDQLHLLHLSLNELLSQLCNLVAPKSADISPLPCRVGKPVPTERTTASESSTLSPHDQKLVNEMAKIFSDIRPHDCHYCIGGRRP